MRELIAGALLIGVLAGCGSEEIHHSKNQDPRKGRVLEWSDCWDDYCYTDWKVCVGTDLLVSVADRKKWLRKSEECKP